MRKATKCGRLIRLRNGSTKHIKVSEDGGSRSCSLIDDSMNFVRVHYHLRRFFHIRYPQKSVLYDFKHQPLSFRNFRTLGDYMRRFGLNGHHTALYLCTFESDRSETKFINRKRIPIRSVRNTAVLRTSQTNSLCEMPIVREFSLTNTCEDLLKLVRRLAEENPSNRIVIQLHRHIYTIYELVQKTIQPRSDDLHRKLTFANIETYSRGMNSIIEESKLTIDFLSANEHFLRRMTLYKQIRCLFDQFYNKLKPPNMSNSSEFGYSRKISDSFKDILYDLNRLMKDLDVTFSSFRTLMHNAIDNVKQQELIVNSNNNTSVYDTKQTLRRMKDEIGKTTGDLKRNQSIFAIDKRVLGQYDKTLWSLHSLLSILDSYSSNSNENKISDRSTCLNKRIIFIDDDD